MILPLRIFLFLPSITFQVDFVWKSYSKNGNISPNMIDLGAQYRVAFSKGIFKRHWS